MGIFGGDSKSESEIKQADNKANNSVQDEGVNVNIAGLDGNYITTSDEGHAVSNLTNSTVNIEDFNKSFGLEVIDKTINAINANLGRSLDYTNETVNRVLSDQNAQLQTISKTPDDRLESMVKIFMVGAIGLAGYGIYKGIK